MDEVTAVRLYRRIRDIAARLFGIKACNIRAYILVIVTTDGHILESTNLIDDRQVAGVLAKAALSTVPHRRHVDAGLN